MAHDVVSQPLRLRVRLDRNHRKMMSKMMNMATTKLHQLLRIVCFVGAFCFISKPSFARADDDYTLSSPENESLMVAMGCFWCAEEAMERYAPGVIEAVSGYAGGYNDYPSYTNHRGHYEVVLVEYDPTETSYGVLLEYAWRNIDPFNDKGQFCDSGHSYLPAIFYGTDEERDVAEIVQRKVLEEYSSWNRSDLAVPILERPRFWTAEKYHQNYYIKNPRIYRYYKDGCGRVNRLKDVWGEDVHECYHDKELSCIPYVTNAYNETVPSIINIKGIEEGNLRFFPTTTPFFSVVQNTINSILDAVSYVNGFNI